MQCIYNITSGNVVVDSAFQAGTVHFLVKLAQTVPNGIGAVRARAATSNRQSAE